MQIVPEEQKKEGAFFGGKCRPILHRNTTQYGWHNGLPHYITQNIGNLFFNVFVLFLNTEQLHLFIKIFGG